MAMVPADQAAQVPVPSKWRSVRLGLNIYFQEGLVWHVCVLGLNMFFHGMCFQGPGKVEWTEEEVVP